MKRQYFSILSSEKRVFFVTSRLEKATYLCAVLLAFLFFQSAAYSENVPVQLAKSYKQENYRDAPSITEYLVSEKYDGIRAIWKNGQLQTRNGNLIYAPKWFTETLPNVWLDGELWSKRQDFEFVASTVKKKVPIDTEWRKITYMVFDAPETNTRFSERVKTYTTLIEKLKLAHVKPVKQFSVNSNEALTALLEDYNQAGAEGLMLHKANALFADGRTDNLLKLKPYMDAEAVVIKHIPGKGKYQGMLGALAVRWINASGKEVIFKIGTGFKDRDRKMPPAIGATITFKYHGLTKKGIPRFASYMRPREAGF